MLNRDRSFPLTREQMQAHLTLNGFFAARIGPPGIAKEGLQFFFLSKVGRGVLSDAGTSSHFRKYEQDWESLRDDTFWKLALHLVGHGLC